jgi:hypothetical protein
MIQKVERRQRAGVLTSNPRISIIMSSQRLAMRA